MGGTTRNATHNWCFSVRACFGETGMDVHSFRKRRQTPRPAASLSMSYFWNGL
jgi:hypothetical protein